MLHFQGHLFIISETKKNNNNPTFLIYQEIHFFPKRPSELSKQAQASIFLFTHNNIFLISKSYFNDYVEPLTIS